MIFMIIYNNGFTSHFPQVFDLFLIISHRTWDSAKLTTFWGYSEVEELWKRNHFNSVYKRFGVFAKGFPRKTVLEIIPHFVYVKTKYSKPETVKPEWACNIASLLLLYTLRDISWVPPLGTVLCEKLRYNTNKTPLTELIIKGEWMLLLINNFNIQRIMMNNKNCYENTKDLHIC